MALKKSQLYSYLWKSCDELRGGMDASQYKDYILTLLFVKYVSDKSIGKRDVLIEVPAGGSFADMVRLKGDKEIGDKINKIIGRLAEANDLKGVIDQADFNNEAKLGAGKEMVDRLTKLIGIFEGIDLSANRAEGDDLLGDAYEYLMRNFATESGKSKGQFYTPAEVSRIMAAIIGAGQAQERTQTVYDPTCGSGSLLIKVADQAPNSLTIYGQEMDNATAGLAHMNMILHSHETAEIWQGNTLASPHWTDKNNMLDTHDFVVANPPFSQKNWTSGVNTGDDPYQRFEFGVPPDKNGDYAFLLHILKSMKNTGKAAVILPHGVLFRGNAEANIRYELVRRGFIKGIISLPPNLFFGTGIPACIIMLDKEHAQARRGIFMMDASQGFRKDGNKNRLRERDIHRIVSIFQAQDEVPGYARMVTFSEIEDNDYNLNIPRYIPTGGDEDLQDLDAHLHGGIPLRDVDALEAYWQALPNLRAALFAPLREGYVSLRVEARQVKAAILQHPDFKTYMDLVRSPFEAWTTDWRPLLKDLEPGGHPKVLIRELAEDLLARFAFVPLLNGYDLYQHLMDYWAETMQDDVYSVMEDGWVQAAQLRSLADANQNGIKEDPDLTVGKQKYKADLIPPDLLAARFFPAELEQIDVMQTAVEQLAAVWDAFDEEHSAEDDPLQDARADNGSLSVASLRACLKGMRGLPPEDEDRKLLEGAARLLEVKGAAEKALKKSRKELDEKLVERYTQLTAAEVQTLLVDDKWLTTLTQTVEEELQRTAQRLDSRVGELADRYAEALPELEQAASDLAARVAAHLQSMGLRF